MADGQQGKDGCVVEKKNQRKVRYCYGMLQKNIPYVLKVGQSLLLISGIRSSSTKGHNIERACHAYSFRANSVEVINKVCFKTVSPACSSKEMTIRLTNACGLVSLTRQMPAMNSSAANLWEIHKRQIMGLTLSIMWDA